MRVATQLHTQIFKDVDLPEDRQYTQYRGNNTDYHIAPFPPVLTLVVEPPFRYICRPET
ncbi:hypothetical protein D3C74_494020 [compost metagenome]